MTETSKNQPARTVRPRRLTLAMVLEKQPGCRVAVAVVLAAAVLPVTRKHR